MIVRIVCLLLGPLCWRLCATDPLVPPPDASSDRWPRPSVIRAAIPL